VHWWLWVLIIAGAILVVGMAWFGAMALVVWLARRR
jgi:hypothetical protein